MEKENQVTKPQVAKGESANKGKNNGNANARTKKTRIDNVPWKHQDICIVDNVKDCKKLVNELQSYV